MPNSRTDCDIKKVHQILQKISDSSTPLTREELGGGGQEIVFIFDNDLMEPPIKDPASVPPRHTYTLTNAGKAFLKGKINPFPLERKTRSHNP